MRWAMLCTSTLLAAFVVPAVLGHAQSPSLLNASAPRSGSCLQAVLTHSPWQAALNRLSGQSLSAFASWDLFRKSLASVNRFQPRLARSAFAAVCHVWRVSHCHRVYVARLLLPSVPFALIKFLLATSIAFDRALAAIKLAQAVQGRSSRVNHAQSRCARFRQRQRRSSSVRQPRSSSP